jgi:hypothetical protein
MNEEPTVSLSVSLKVNLGGYESADAFLCCSGLRVGATEAEINELLDTGKLAFSIMKGRILDQAREMRRVGHQSKALDPTIVSVGERDRNARLYLRRNLNCTDKDFNEFKALAGDGWYDVALAAEQAGINSVPELLQYAQPEDKAA